MEVENNMFSFINHNKLAHLAIPFFYTVNNDNICKNCETSLLYNPKCISDNLFNTFFKSENIDDVISDVPNKKKIKNTRKKNNEHNKKTRKFNKKNN